MQTLTRKPKTLNWWQALLFLLLLILASILTATTLEPIFSLLPLTGTLREVVVNIVNNVALLGGCLAVCIAWSGRTWSETLPHHLPRGLHGVGVAFASVLIAVGGSILLSELDNLMRVFFTLPNIVGNYFEELSSNPNYLGWGILLFCIIAPFTEEYIFRGFVLRNLARRHRPWVAIVMSALIFGLFHLNPAQIPFAFFMGILLAWSVWVSDSMVPGLIIHAVANGLDMLFQYVFHWSIPGYSVAGSFQPWWFDVTGLLLLVAGVVLMLICTKSKTRLYPEMRVPHVIQAIADAFSDPFMIPMAGQADTVTVQTDAREVVPDYMPKTPIARIHHWSGIAAFAVSLIALALSVVGLVYAVQGDISGSVAAFCNGFGSALVWWAAIFATVAMLRKDSKKLFPVMALVLIALSFSLSVVSGIIFGLMQVQEQMPFYLR